MAKKPKEYFRVRRVLRRFDRLSGKFIVNVSFETAAPTLSDRVIATSEAFGLGLDELKKFTVFDEAELKIGLKDIVYITGDSGSGKSVLLRALEKDIKQDLQLSSVNVADVAVEPDEPLIETVGKTVEEGLGLLARVGLGDAFLFLRTFSQLSDGQKYRYRIAKMIEAKAQFWILDEFAATLDRDTARILAWNLQKLARAERRCVLAATTHMDLFEDLNPSVHVHKRFGKEITVNYYPNQPARECSLIKEMQIEEGTTKDWRELAAFHYRSHKIAAPRKIFSLKRSQELCGVIVYCYPPTAAYGRRLVLPRMSMKELNSKLCTISRVVIHPKYRTIGLGEKLVRETLPQAGTEYVEMSAVMAKYNPFAEKAGMRRIAEQQPPKEALRIVDVLRELGFNEQFLSSQTHVLTKLQSLSNTEIERVRQAFLKYSHPRFMKAFSYHLPYGLKEAYRKEIENLTIERLAHLIRICGFLMQTKVYLFWKNFSV